MADIFHTLSIQAPITEVFEAISSPEGLDVWWTRRSAGEPALKSKYELWFGPGYDWRALVSKCSAPLEFEFELIDASEDWWGTKVGFDLAEKDGVTHVAFRHTGWPEVNDHFRTSSYCWAMYLRLLKRFVENGEVIPYKQRLEA